MVGSEKKSLSFYLLFLNLSYWVNNIYLPIIDSIFNFLIYITVILS